MLNLINEREAFLNFNWSVFLHFVARQLYSIFTPIILLENGFDVNQVLLFFLFSSFVSIFSSYFGYKLLGKKNIVWFNFIAILSEIGLLSLLSFNDFNKFIFIGIFVLDGCYYAFYYLSYEAIFNHYTSVLKVRNNAGNLIILGNIAALVSPIIGSYLIRENKLFLILIAIFFLFLSLYMLSKIAGTDINGNHLKKIKIGEMWFEFFNISIMNIFELVMYFLWAVYIYTLELPLIYIGLIPVFSSLTQITVIAFFKNRLDNLKLRLFLKYLCVSVLMSVCFQRFYYPEYIVLSNLIGGIFFILFNFILGSDLREKLNGHQTYHSAMVMNVLEYSIKSIAIILGLFLGIKNLLLLPVFFGIIFIIGNLIYDKQSYNF